MNNDWIKSLKAGDKVIVCYRGIYSYDTVKTVDKVTPTGRIKVGCDYYNPNGWPRNHGGTHLEEATAEALEAVWQREVIHKAVSRAYAIRADGITYDQAVKLLEVLDDGA